VQEQKLVSSVIESFPQDVADHLEGTCRSDRGRIPTPKVVDLTDGVVTYDERQERKQPDWTYS
jgi:NADH-quinone oxidoreductase subunit F